MNPHWGEGHQLNPHLTQVKFSLCSAGVCAYQKKHTVWSDFFPCCKCVSILHTACPWNCLCGCSFDSLFLFAHSLFGRNNVCICRYEQLIIFVGFIFIYFFYWYPNLNLKISLSLWLSYHKYCLLKLLCTSGPCTYASRCLSFLASCMCRFSTRRQHVSSLHLVCTHEYYSCTRKTLSCNSVLGHSLFSKTAATLLCLNFWLVLEMWTKGFFHFSNVVYETLHVLTKQKTCLLAHLTWHLLHQMQSLQYIAKGYIKIETLLSDGLFLLPCGICKQTFPSLVIQVLKCTPSVFCQIKRSRQIYLAFLLFNKTCDQIASAYIWKGEISKFTYLSTES